MPSTPQTDLRALGEATPSSLAATLRSALGVALVLGVVAGMLDGAVALVRADAGMELAVFPVSVLLASEVLAVALLLAALIFHGVLRRAPERSVRRLFAFLGSAVAGAAVALVVGGPLWSSSVLVLVGAALCTWLLERLGARATTVLRLMALLMAAAGVFVLRGAALAEARDPGGEGTTALLVVVLPGLELEDLRTTAAGQELALTGVLLEQVSPLRGWEDYRMRDFLYPEGVDALSAMVREAGAHRSEPVDLWRELSLPPEAVPPRRRALGSLTVRRIEHLLQRRAGDTGLVIAGLEWLSLRGSRPSAMVVGLSGSADSVARAALLEELRSGLESGSLGERTLLLLVGSPLGVEPLTGAETFPALFCNTRLVPHGGNLEVRQSFESLLPAASVLLGWGLEEDRGSALASALAEARAEEAKR